MEEKLISEFNVSDKIQGFYLISNFNVKTSSNNKMYLDMDLQDNSGQINAKLWNIQNDEHEKFKAGNIVKVRGIVTEWQGENQFKIHKIRLANEDEFDLEKLIVTAPIDPLETFDKILETVNNFENEDIKNITKKILKINKEKLLYYPAAKSNHHSIRAGLLYHIGRMLEVAKSLANIYKTVDKDLLFAGVILHDIEKVNEMISDEIGVVSDYSKDGKLLGHIIMGIKTIEKVGEECGADKEVVTLLEHMILSHHNEPEYGSPKRPMFLEAELLHHIDIIDARVYDFDEIDSSLEKGEFSNPIWTLDKRRVYKKK
ncbi:MAG: 3'-5' exoribonuclease YhaM family protein [Bacillota bacterium]